MASEKILNVTDADFDEKVLASEGTVLVDFWAPWCGPCKMLAPVLDDLANELDGKLTIAKVDVDQNTATAQKYNVMGIPALLVIKNGEVVQQMAGYMPKEVLLSKIKPSL